MAEADAATLAELRRRIQGSFSPGELRGLGATLGLAPSSAWDGGADSLVRDLVRRAIEGPGLAALIEQLGQAKPLVEWADLMPPARGGDTEIADLDVGARPTPVAPAPVLDPAFSPASASAEGDAPPPSSVAGSAPAVPVAPAPAPAAGWPMANLNAAEEPRRGIEPRLFVIALACIALAVVVAFAGGMVWSRHAAPGPVAAGRSPGLAGHAADAVDGALLDVASACGMPPPGAPGREILRLAQITCGHPVAAAVRPLPGFDPSTIEPPELELGPEGRPRAPVRTGKGAKTPATPGDPCRAGCSSDHSGCKSGCGAEPRDASDYDAWQSCQGKCLSAESRCRQSCK